MALLQAAEPVFIVFESSVQCHFHCSIDPWRYCTRERGFITASMYWIYLLRNAAQCIEE